VNNLRIPTSFVMNDTREGEPARSTGQATQARHRGWTRRHAPERRAAAPNGRSV